MSSSSHVTENVPEVRNKEMFESRLTRLADSAKPWLDRVLQENGKQYPRIA
jgi:hypothetical protein